MATVDAFITGDFFPLPDLTTNPLVVGELIIDLIDLDPSNIRRKFSDENLAHEHQDSNFPGTVLDIDCRNHPKRKEGSAIEVRVRIDNTLNARFVDHKGGNALLPVTAGSLAARAILGNYVWVSEKEIKFLIVWNKTEGFLPFNLCMVFTDPNDSTLQMPVIYDPKVQNDG